VKVVLGFALTLLCVSCTPISPAAKIPKSEPQVIRLTGTPEYSQHGATWKKLTPGQKLTPGVHLRTPANSHVDIALTLPNTFMRLAPASEAIIELDKLDRNISETQLNLKSGRLLVSVPKLEMSSIFEVKLGLAGVAGVRGGRNPDEPTELEADSNGVVTVSSGGAVVVHFTDFGRIDGGMATLVAGQTMKPRKHNDSFSGSADPSPLERLRLEFRELHAPSTIK